MSQFSVGIMRKPLLQVAGLVVASSSWLEMLDYSSHLVDL